MSSRRRVADTMAVVKAVGATAVAAALGRRLAAAARRNLARHRRLPTTPSSQVMEYLVRALVAAPSPLTEDGEESRFRTWGAASGATRTRVVTRAWAAANGLDEALREVSKPPPDPRL